MTNPIAVLKFDAHLSASDAEIVRRGYEALARISEIQPRAIAYVRGHGFVFDRLGPIPADADELTRWKVLAFSLYSDLCEADAIARGALILDE